MADLAWTRSTGGTWTLQEYNHREWEQAPIVGQRFGLYLDEQLIASVEAANAYEARDLFKRHGLSGNRVRRL